ncbi:hypothetical protein LV779_12645 [Streptomyces thinghirensis]|nr:hypothetical protein [Streptomyces thinghirensis]
MPRGRLVLGRGLRSGDQLRHPRPRQPGRRPGGRAKPSGSPARRRLPSLIDDQLVVNHDGLHDREPKDATVDPDGQATYSSRIEHFELRRRSAAHPGLASAGRPGFTVVVPNSVLSTTPTSYA